MLTISLVMVLILVVAGLVMTFVAYPHRGQQVPQAPWLGAAMTRVAERAPLLDREQDEVPAGRGR
ncbi:hypothetical protein [Nocardioides deserti]|uniref:Uncharacterized protein n=1 Tax=Nocardioides deserti TaxID=1588644 RepID=A0ABR6UCI1_9ACTN|nr:hypothetical protein [Nocardioides deserti]MBC2962075.1 hypothetical protein [Nocardioides deserti]GGO70236.1 hypothetical protein GCM10012276_08320 [Nocardioides deserti]